MTKKPYILFALLTLCLPLAACSPATPTVSASPSAVTGTPGTPSVYATPDESMATPAVGFGTILALQGPRAVLIYSRPDINATPSGSVLPGDAGKIMGLDATGKWALVDVKDQIGWIPLQQLAYNIAQ